MGTQTFHLKLKLAFRKHPCFFGRVFWTEGSPPSPKTHRRNPSYMGELALPGSWCWTFGSFWGGTGGKACQHGKFLGPTSCISEFSTPFTVCKKSKLSKSSTNRPMKMKKYFKRKRV